MIELLYFGRVSDLFQCDSERLDLPASVTNTSELRTWLDTRSALDGSLLDKTIRIAVNGEMVHDPYPVSEGDEIAFIPPVGGG